MERLVRVIEAEGVPFVPGGLEAIVFTADGDMRQGLNNLQATHSGFGLVSQENVFKVCDQPHPLAVAAIVDLCSRAAVDDAFGGVKALHEKGYSAMDIIGTLFRVVKSFDDKKLPEALKLDFIREIGFCHMRVGDGVSSLLQLAGAGRRRARAGVGAVGYREGCSGSIKIFISCACVPLLDGCFA